ncbi:hypothetical protein EG832_16505, partial [bacterium]|nr:hypothetical protein [bacterium]
MKFISLALTFLPSFMNRRFLFWIVFIAINGGFLFGLNMAGISGAVDMIKGEFSLGDSGLGIVAALLTIGVLFGGLFSGYFSDNNWKEKVMNTPTVVYIFLGAGSCFV